MHKEHDHHEHERHERPHAAHEPGVRARAGRESGHRAATQAKVLYFDCIAGIAGDMCLGALLDLGCPLEYLQGELAKLDLNGRFELTASAKLVNGVKARHAVVKLTQPDTQARGLSAILRLISAAGLKPSVEQNASRIFHLLGEAEAAVHGDEVEHVHFHEVGAVDAIVDIVGTCVAADYFAPSAIYCSPLKTGTGVVQCAHGVLPVPSPAVVRLAEGRTLEYLDVKGETTTPTGAAILAGIAQEKTNLKLKVLRAGYGCGTRQFKEVPNLLRVVEAIEQ